MIQAFLFRTEVFEVVWAQTAEAFTKFLRRPHLRTAASKNNFI